MAKYITKPSAATTTSTKSTGSKKSAKAADIETVSRQILEKLKELNLDEQLQSEIEWCLGSYAHDKNPVGLIQTANNAINVFKTELARKTKGVTAKLITDLEKAIQTF